MTDPGFRTKAELLKAIEESRAGLDALLKRARPDELTGRRDDAGWNVKDHLAHIAAWERSLIALLAGRSRAKAVGIDDGEYAGLDTDGINARIQAEHEERPLALILSEYQEVHEQVMYRVRRMSQEDLEKPYSHYQPDEPGEQAGAPIVGWIIGNTCGHFDEHRNAIEALLA
ncbi:MAG: ClbS/DfsB family four-helix bundle protein [Dehalococcoidia bacterium]|nr:ClbS/DfsB family four-helix bundle protein [Dehalococcoidia bacterium]